MRQGECRGHYSSCTPYWQPAKLLLSLRLANEPYIGSDPSVGSLRALHCKGFSWSLAPNYVICSRHDSKQPKEILKLRRTWQSCTYGLRLVPGHFADSCESRHTSHVRIIAAYPRSSEPFRNPHSGNGKKPFNTSSSFVHIRELPPLKS